MQHRRRVFWFVSFVLVTLLVGACSSTPPLIDDEQPLLTDADIDKAILALASSEQSLMATEATLPVGKKRTSLTKFTSNQAQTCQPKPFCQVSQAG
jgi:hypothetical protein